MLEILNVVLPVFILIGVGYLTVWLKIFTDALVDALMRFAVTLAVPALLFQGISTLDLQANFEAPILLSFYLGAFLCFLIGLFGARVMFKRPWPDSVVIGFCCLFSNSLMLGLPIAERAYGAEALSGNFTIISIHSLFAYSIGITVMEVVKARGKSVFQIIVTVLRGMTSNALVIAIALAFVVNLTGIHIPGPVSDSISLLAQTALPTALFAVGGVLRRYKPEGDVRTILFICAVSLALHPSLSFLFGKAFGITKDSLRSVITTASMAPGLNAFLFANLYSCAKRVAASSVLIGTAISILTVSMWLIIVQ